MLKKINNHQKTNLNGFKNSKSIYITVGLTSLTILSGLVLSSSTVSADDVVDNVAITVPISCTMSGTGMNTHTKEVVNGTYEENIGTTTMKVLCNDNSGFSIYATGFTNETIAETNSNKLVGTNASGNATIDTGIAESGNTSNWAMKLATNSQATYPITITSDTEGPFSSYHTVPNEYTKVATRLAGTDIGVVAEGSTITSTYAAYINSTQPADTYTGKVKYTLVHPHDAAKPRVAKSLDTATTLQEVTFCSPDLPLDQPFILTDSRDGTSYHVARLRDGKCWLQDNLALDPTDPTVAFNMSEENTNASAAAIANFLNGGNQNNTTGWTSTPVTDVDSDFNVEGFTVPRINNASKDVLVKGFGPAATDGQSRTGVFYNYCAASVGTFCYEENQGAGLPDTLIDVPEDICPAGWRMPTINPSSGSWSGDIFELEPSYYDEDGCFTGRVLLDGLSLNMPGIFRNTLAGQSERGEWWTSTWAYGKYVSGIHLQIERFDITGIYTYALDRSNGLSVRCLLDVQ